MGIEPTSPRQPPELRQHADARRRLVVAPSRRLSLGCVQRSTAHVASLRGGIPIGDIGDELALARATSYAAAVQSVSDLKIIDAAARDRSLSAL